MDDPKLVAGTVAYLDGLFGEGSGAKHTRFLEHIKNDHLRSTLHRFHAQEAETSLLSHEENYLIGLCVLCASRTWATAGMFAKTLRHLGCAEAKILEAVARLSMWIGAIPAAEASAHVQRALDDYAKRGVESLEAWFPKEG